MTLRRTLLPATLAGALLLGSEPLAACGFHAELPEATVSEQIVDAATVIAARPSANNPFRFEAVETMKGSPPESRPPQLVDSPTRTRLARNPGEAVLFARALDGSWTRLLVLDAATRPLVERMIARAEVWTSPEGAIDKRETFADLLTHPDAVIRRLALHELDALPYTVLRERTYPVAADELLRRIADIQDVPYAPIRILLLGLSGEDTAHAAIAEKLRRLAETGTASNLGAWATAMTESAGTAGLANLERMFLSPGKQLPEAQRTELVRALAIISSEGDPVLRTEIDRLIRVFVSFDPGAAPLIAQAFSSVGDYSQVDVIRELIAARAFSDRTGLMAATAYITRAGGGTNARLSMTRPGQVANVP